MLLTIGIPTYNRAKDLDYNLSLLTKSIIENKLAEQICILISDNASTDNTKEVICKYKQKGKIKIYDYIQNQNTGIEYNTLFVVRQAETPYVMTLGDDDYLEPDYLVKCINKLFEYRNLGLIIPNKDALDPITKQTSKIHDFVTDDVYFYAGFKACLKNSYLGHQLSGLVFKKDAEIMESYIEHNVHNLYPTIYLVSATALKFDVLFIGEVCVHVSEIPLAKKDWNYSKDGLVSDIFDNYKKLSITPLQRIQLELAFWNSGEGPWRLSLYTGIKKVFTSFRMCFGRNTSLLGGLYIFVSYWIKYVYKIPKRIINKLKKSYRK